MKCPFCGDQESKVVDSRHSEDGLSIRRRRECMGCQRRFTTYEIVESLPIPTRWSHRVCRTTPFSAVRRECPWYP